MLLSTYYVYDLSTARLTILVRDLTLTEKDILQSNFGELSPDGRYMAVSDFFQLQDYYVIDSGSQTMHLPERAKSPNSLPCGGDGVGINTCVFYSTVLRRFFSSFSAS